jgi:hypothetical protein
MEQRKVSLGRKLVDGKALDVEVFDVGPVS